MAHLRGRRFSFEVLAAEPGILAGVAKMEKVLRELGLEVEMCVREGGRLHPGVCVCRAKGEAEGIVLAEDLALSHIGKPSGVATAAAKAVERAGPYLRVVCGAWKKVAPELRPELRRAITLGGVGVRITERPFVYLDKNYVRLLGGVRPAVERARNRPDRTVVVQLRGETSPIELEAKEAVDAGAGILMVDTGCTEDLARVVDVHRREGWAGLVEIAFAGGIKLSDIPQLAAMGAHILDVGRAIIDAPLLDFRLDVKV